MAVNTILATRTIVITAQNFNPSILSEAWLLNHGILVPNERIGDFVFSNSLVQYSTAEYSLTVLTSQIQLVFLDKNESSILDKTLKKITALLPYVPYKGIGINFSWEMTSDESTMLLSKKLFFSSESPVFSSLESDDAYYGAYVSKDFLLGRMKLDMKPQIRVQSGEEKEEFMAFQFNYHHDILVNNPILSLNEILDNWSKYMSDSETVMKKIVK